MKLVHNCFFVRITLMNVQRRFLFAQVQSALTQMLTANSGQMPDFVIALSASDYLTDRIVAEQISWIGLVPFSFAMILGVQTAFAPRPTYLVSVSSYWGDPVLLASVATSCTQLGVVQLTFGRSASTGLFIPRVFNQSAPISFVPCTGATSTNCTNADPIMAAAVTVREQAFVALITRATTHRSLHRRPCRWLLPTTLWMVASPFAGECLTFDHALCCPAFGSNAQCCGPVFTYCRIGECTLGSLSCAAMRWWVNTYYPQATCDFSFFNGGAIRTSIPAGTISTIAVLSALPFADAVVSLQLQGAALVSALQWSLSALGGANTGLFLQMDGIRIVYNSQMPVS